MLYKSKCVIFVSNLSSWPAKTNAAKANKGAACPSDPPCKWEVAFSEWLRLITTKQLQTCGDIEKGAQPCCQASRVGRSRQPVELCYPHFPPTPWGPHCSPVPVLLPHQVLWLKLQGGKGIMSVNMTALTMKCHGLCSAGRNSGRGGLGV